MMDLSSFRAILFDWGDTIMKDFPNETGKMCEWHQVEAMPNAEKTLLELSKFTDCYIATNAVDSNKEDIIKALQRVGLAQYFKDIFCFQKIGFSKPSKAYFDAIIDKLQIEKHEILMIGDNLEKDVNGAIDYGIQAILYDFWDVHKNYHGKKIKDLRMILDFMQQQSNSNKTNYV